MIKYLKYIVLNIAISNLSLCLDNVFLGYSSPCIIDFLDPEVTLLSPNGGDEVPSNDYSLIEWIAEDDFGIADNGIDPEQIIMIEKIVYFKFIANLSL